MDRTCITSDTTMYFIIYARLSFICRLENNGMIAEIQNELEIYFVNLVNGDILIICWSKVMREGLSSG